MGKTKLTFFIPITSALKKGGRGGGYEEWQNMDYKYMTYSTDTNFDCLFCNVELLYDFISMDNEADLVSLSGVLSISLGWNQQQC